MELPSSEIKKNSCILQKKKKKKKKKKFPEIFHEMETPKNTSYISGGKETSSAQKMKEITLKKFPLFYEMGLSSCTLKKNSYISGIYIVRIIRVNFYVFIEIIFFKKQ